MYYLKFILSKYWFWFFIGAIVMAVFGPGLMPFSTIFLFTIFIVAIVFLLVYNNQFKNPQRFVNKRVNSRSFFDTATKTYFDVIESNPERFRRFHFIPMAGSILLISFVDVLMALLFVTLPAERPEFLQAIPQIVSDNSTASIIYFVIFALLAITGTVLFVMHLHGIWQKTFRRFMDVIRQIKEKQNNENNGG